MTSPAPRASRPPIWAFLARIALAIAVFVVGALVALALLPDGSPDEVSTLLNRIVGGAGISMAVIATVVVLTRRVDRRPLREIGMTPPADAARAFASGAAVWVLVAIPSFALFALSGAPIEITAPGGEFWVTLALLLAAVLLAEAVPEELVFRGYVTRVLGERLRGWWIIVAQAALFTLTAVLLHGAVPAVVDLSLYVALGIGLGYLRMITGSVWTAVGFHTAFQTGSQLLLTHSVIDFGGTSLQFILATGAIPFGVGITLISLVTSWFPQLFAASTTRSPDGPMRG